ncbi:DUF4129 domain-containing protein [Nocardia pseudovaccinii]|uniref:DUF4129 domain-containing protein n=1 Tax=Nocardia pseudovaccinii TaxID=189540 RepID=UPI0007A3A8E3|nr:DUF4129 domain-containing protein [Nocardia pseudovaccinii]
MSLPDSDFDGGIDRRIARSVFGIVAVVVTVVALHGYLPGVAGHAATESPKERQSVVPLAAIAGVSVCIVVVSVLSFLRRPAGGARQSAERVLGDRRRRRVSGRELLMLAVLFAVMAGPAVAASWLILRPSADHPARPADAGAQHAAAATPAPPGSTLIPLDDNQFRVLGIAAAAAILAAVSAVGAVMVRAVRRRAAVAAPVPDTATVRTALARAVSAAVHETAAPQRDPRATIISCYRAMEAEFAAVPGLSPALADTPSDVLARAVELGVVAHHTAARLVALFAEARYSAHPMGERDRIEAAALLRAVLAGLKEDSAQ